MADAPSLAGDGTTLCRSGGMGASRTERIELRVTAAELEAWRAAAPGRNVSAWLRGLASRELAGRDWLQRKAERSDFA
jgi:hypothetical protein